MPETRTFARDDPNMGSGEREIVRQQYELVEELEHEEEELEPQTVLPSSLQKMALKFFHDSNGHPGIKRTVATLQTKYFWIGLTSTARDHVQRCIRCSRRKMATSTQAGKPSLHQDIPTRAFQRVHTDLMTDLPRTVSGNKHISTTVCALTGYLQATALPDRTAETVARSWIDNIMLNYGAPEIIHTDNGGEYINSIIASINNLLRIRHMFTVPYNPQANGSAEKRNATLTDMLTNFTNSYHNDWDIYLPVVCWAYNTTINSATGYSPFRAMFGRETKAP